MNATRLWQIGAALVIVAILALGYVVGVSPKLSEASDAAAQLQQANGQNAAEQSTVDKLQGEYNNMSALEAKLATLQLSIPSTPDGGDFVREINADVQASGVTFNNISFGEPTPFANSSNTNTSAVAPVATPTATPTPAATSTAAPTTPTAATGASAANAPTPAAGVAYTVAVTMNVTGSTAQVMQFDSLLQNGSRLFLATGLGFGTSSSTTKTTTSGAASTSTTTTGDSGSFTGYVFVVSGTTATPSPVPSSSDEPTPLPTDTAIPTSTPSPTPTPTGTAKP